MINIKNKTITIHEIIERLKNNSLAKDSFWAVFGNGFGTFLLLVGGIIIARLLGKDLYGEYGVVKTTMFQIAGFATFGLGYTSTKFVAEYLNTNKEQVKGVICSSITISFTTSFLLCLLLFFFATPLAGFINEPRLSSAFQYLGVIIILRALSVTENGILSGMKRFQSMGINSIISGLCLLICGAVFTYFWSVQGSLLALLFSQLILLILNSICIYKETRDYPDSSNKNFMYILGFSLPVSIQELSFTLSHWGATLLVTKYASLGEVGIYSAASQWGAIVLFIPGLLMNVVLSYLSDNAEENQTHQLVFKRMIIVNFASSLIPFVIVLLFSNFIASFYGPTFQGLGLVISIIVLGTVFSSISNVYQSDMISLGKNWTLFIFRIIRDLFIIVSLWVSLQHFHSNAALIFAIISVVSSLLYLLLLVSYKHKLLFVVHCT